jgi:hypothetical protein
MNFPLQSFVWYSTIRLLTTSKILSFGPVSSGPDEFAATDGQMDASSPFFADVPTVHPEPAALTLKTRKCHRQMKWPAGANRGDPGVAIPAAVKRLPLSNSAWPQTPR